MKKYLWLATIILFLSLVSTIYAQQLNEFQNLIIDTNLYGRLDASQSGKLAVNLSLFPKEDSRQQVLNLKTFPQAQLGDTISYSWYSDIAEFGWNASIKTNAFLQEIGHINFPVLINEYSEYKQPTEYIDINDAIIRKANELVSGKTDLFEAIHEIGNFVYTNMTYDEAYINTTQKASWVLENKRGVCDEYSILFISLIRSLGIPARYITGIAYSENKNSFGNHGWAEVYFPGHGWIPFDSTFGQLGWIDSTHVALSKWESPQNSIIYTYQKGVEINAIPINVTANIMQKTNKFSEMLIVNAYPLKDEARFGSYIPLKVEIENLNDFFVPAIIYIIKSPSKIIDGNVKNILVGPNEKATIFFILEIPFEQKGYIYTSNIEVKSQFNDVAETSIKFSDRYEYMSLQEAQQIVSELTTGKQSLIYSVNLNCTYDRDFYYKDEQMNVFCKIRSNSNTFLENLKLCIEDQCRTFDLPINSEIEKDFALEAKSYIVKLSNTKVLESAYLSTTILERPDLKILEIKQKQLDYKNGSLTLLIKTNSICNNLKIKANNKEVELNSVEGQKDIKIEFAGKNALKEKIDVKAECYDLRELNYKDEKTFDIQIENIPWYGKIIKFFVNIF